MKISKKDSKLPFTYGETYITAMVRDPYWIFCYWEILSNEIEESQNKETDAKAILRIHDITNIEFNGRNAHYFFDSEAVSLRGSQYINLKKPNRTYCVEIGIKTADSFNCLARSGSVMTPPAWISESMEEYWTISEEDFGKLYTLSGGYDFGITKSGASKGRSGIKELLENISSPVRKNKR